MKIIQRTIRICLLMILLSLLSQCRSGNEIDIKLLSIWIQPSDIHDSNISHNFPSIIFHVESRNAVTNRICINTASNSEQGFYVILNNGHELKLRFMNPYAFDDTVCIESLSKYRVSTMGIDLVEHLANDWSAPVLHRFVDSIDRMEFRHLNTTIVSSIEIDVPIIVVSFDSLSDETIRIPTFE